MNIFSFSHFTVRFSEEWKVKSEEWKGVSAKRKLVGPSGLEPPTSCLSGTRSNLLSYDPSWLVKWFFTWNGGDDGIRTHDPLLAGQVLSQLSYTPIFSHRAFAQCLPLGFAFLYLFLTFGVDFTPLHRLVSALNYLPVQSPVKYCRHCRA